MKEEKLTLLGGTLLWFGAAIVITEIMTGAMIEPLGFSKGVLSIILGHLIGCILFFYFGLIGAKKNKGAMESTEIAFGRKGSLFFSLFNVLQLIGWTAIMIISGADAMNSATGVQNTYIWCIVIGCMICIWIFAGLKNISKISIVAVGLLFILSLILSYIVFNGDLSTKNLNESISFGLAMELSIAMPLSWLPLISDYTKGTDKPVKLTLISAISYFLGSCFMYIIGLGAAINFGTSDIIEILVSSGLGLMAMIIVIFSTVTTTFLDVYSAGESTVNIFKNANQKVVCYIVCIIGTIMAMIFPVFQFESFLLLLGAVFVPMAVVMIADYFITKNTEFDKTRSKINIVLWVIGVIVYRIFLSVDTVVGSTIPVIAIILIICSFTGLLRKGIKNV
ncbi:MAG: putative hydroxymethylpyrimidine transporter CytX [Lachnospirales bacterium]